MVGRITHGTLTSTARREREGEATTTTTTTKAGKVTATRHKITWAWKIRLAEQASKQAIEREKKKGRGHVVDLYKCMLSEEKGPLIARHVEANVAVARLYCTHAHTHSQQQQQ